MLHRFWYENTQVRRVWHLLFGHPTDWFCDWDEHCFSCSPDPYCGGCP